MAKKSPREYSRMVIKELYKHAQRDECYSCKAILRAMGLDPDNIPEGFKA